MRGYMRWAASGYQHFPSLQDIQETDVLWEADLMELYHQDRFLEDIEEVEW